MSDPMAAAVSTFPVNDYALLLEPLADAVLMVLPDLSVGPVYSPMTARVWGRCPTGSPIDELLAPDDAALRSRIRQSLGDALLEQDSERCQLYLDLLPWRTKVGGWRPHGSLTQW